MKMKKKLVTVAADLKRGIACLKLAEAATKPDSDLAQDIAWIRKQAIYLLEDLSIYYKANGDYKVQ